MTCNHYAQYEVHCDEFGRAMSPQVSCQEHKKNDDREFQDCRKQNMVLLQVFQFSKRNEQRFLMTSFRLMSCILSLQVCLFQIFYIVFSLLDIVFHAASLLFQKAFFCVHSHILCGKNDTYLNDRQPFSYVEESRIMALFHNIFCKVLNTYNAFQEDMEISISC